MQKAEVPRSTIADAIDGDADGSYPALSLHRSGAFAQDFEPELEAAMLKSIKGYGGLPAARGY